MYKEPAVIYLYVIPIQGKNDLYNAQSCPVPCRLFILPEPFATELSALCAGCNLNI